GDLIRSDRVLDDAPAGRAVPDLVALLYRVCSSHALASLMSVPSVLRHGQQPMQYQPSTTSGWSLCSRQTGVISWACPVASHVSCPPVSVPHFMQCVSCSITSPSKV